MQPPEVPADKEQRAIKKGEELGFTSREPSETKERKGEGRVMRRHVRTPTRSLYCRARRLNGVPLSLERNAELGITFLMSSRIKCGVSGANVLWERTAGDFTPHYPKTLLLSGDRLVGEVDAR